MFWVKLKKYLNIKQAIRDQIAGNGHLRSLPTRFHFEVNDYCNLDCAMCPRKSEIIPKDSGNLDPAIIRQITRWLPYVLYTGFAGNGEPFLHPQLFEIIEQVRKAGSVPSIVTNGTLLTMERLQRLSQIGPCILVLSFDAAEKKTFEEIRIGANYDRILENLATINDLKKKHNTPFPVVNFLVCAMKKNQKELIGIIDLAKKYNVAKVIFQTIYPFSEMARLNMFADLREVEDATADAINHARNLGIETGLAPLNFGLEKRLAHIGKSFKPGTRLFCENIWQTMHVGVNGDVRFCCFWTGSPIGNLAKKSVPEIWNAPDFVNLRAAISRGDIPKECRDCHILSVHDPDAIRTRLNADIKNL